MENVVNKVTLVGFAGSDVEVKAVSYTHLDVYKRQPICLWF